MKLSLNEIVVKYSQGNTSLSDVDIDKDLFNELLKKYLNDKNSSTLRQDVMCTMANLVSSTNKLGYDGVDSVDEMKPKNHETNNPKSKKLDGGGNYSDMTFKRHHSFIEQNAKIHVGGFVDGKHVFQFKINYVDLAFHFEQQLSKRLPNGDEPNQYLRSMRFSLTQIKECKNVELLFLTKDINQYCSYMTDSLYFYLIGLKK